MMKDDVIVILSQVPWGYPTDYLKQTAFELSKKTKVAVFWPLMMPTYRRLFFERKPAKGGLKSRSQLVLDSPSARSNNKLRFFSSIAPIPFQRLQFIWKMNLFINMVYFWVRYFIRFGFKKPIFWTFYPDMLPVLPYIKWRKKLIYDRVDHVTSIDKKENEVKQKIDQQWLETADMVFVNSPYTLKYVKTYNKRSFLVPCGCNTKLFRVQGIGDKVQGINKNIPDTKYKIPNTNPIIGLAGSLDHRINWNLLYEIAKKRPDWNFVLVGSPISNELAQFKIVGLSAWFSKLKKLANVYFLGQVEKEKLPEILSNFDVCLIPYDIKQESVRGCNPMKLYEYLAMGKPVVSTPIPAVEQYEPVVRIVSDIRGFEQEIENCLNLVYNQAEILKRQKVAEKNNWSKKISTMWIAVKRCCPKS